MKRLSSVFQFILGFFLGIAVLAAGTAALGLVIFSRMNVAPPKPIFAEETKHPPKNTKKAPLAKSSPAQPKGTPKASPSPEEKSEEEKLPKGAYKATVTWSEGLSLRDRPGFDANRVGGVMYNDTLIILETTADGEWQKVRIPGSSQEGWVKAGNIQKVAE